MCLAKHFQQEQHNVRLCLAQAMAAYRTAARLFPGLHLPLIGMGMEYQRMNNLHLAEQMFWQVRRRIHFQPWFRFGRHGDKISTLCV